MNENFSAELLVNKVSVELNPFVEEFLARVTIGAVTPLRGVDYIRSIEIHQDHGDVSVTVNGEEITVTPFPNDIIAGTLIGMVSTLKDVDSVNSLDVSVEAK